MNNDSDRAYTSTARSAGRQRWQKGATFGAAWGLEIRGPASRPAPLAPPVPSGPCMSYSLHDLVNDLIALIPEDGSRLTNDEIRAALEREAGEPISDADLKEIKARAVAMGAAEGVKGPGGGLKAPGVDPPPRSAAPAAGTRTRRSGNGSAAPAPQPPSPPARHRPRHHGGLGAHRRTAQPDRPHLRCLLERRHRQPAGGAGAAHLSAVHPPAG